jgi:hypothetical protein
MVVEEIHTDDDFDRLTTKYARGLGEYVFAGLRARFDDPEIPTFGVLIQRINADYLGHDRFVAVVDCREESTGEKYARRYFTKWHEVAHRMTTHRIPADPAYRAEDDPIETLVDAVASELGFYEPFLSPALQEAIGQANWLTFEMIESIIERVFPEASFQATLFACMRLIDTPMVYVELSDDPFAIQRLLPNAAAYSHWIQAPEFRPDRQPSKAPTIASIPIVQGEVLPGDSVFHRVRQAALLSDQIEHHMCDFFTPEIGNFLGRFPNDSTAACGYPTSIGHRGILTHIQARRVPSKVIALLQY